ncbi:ABC transporter permease [Clostridium rectalis]|uniref:ABC transporter permease n=1 Tax=Clostridium rectalis TaxID=2040295 RepID=UPI000F634B1F|nr:ABC transporter permease [Clostridium rectalis]
MDIISILNSALRMSAPIILAGLGGLFTHKAGVLNIALEGMMLIGAFVSVIVSYVTGNVIIAVISAIGAALLMGLVFSIFGISFKGNFIIIGLAVNIFALGFTSYILQTAFGTRGVFSNPSIIGINKVNFPILDKIPFIGPILNNQTPIVYISLLSVILVNFIIYKTKFGLYVRVVGENEEAAKAVGLNINRIKYSSVFISSIFCALAGVNLSLENLNMFVENMTNGRGFIALAAIFCGKGTPIGTFIFSVLFGFADSLQMRLQSLKIPGSFIQMIPFIFIVVILTVVAIMQNKRRLSREAFDE